jgi:signal transduction histidine kinase/DNA-binding response OmpR family regulator/ligand-binding sensor domain-containing protein
MQCFFFFAFLFLFHSINAQELQFKVRTLFSENSLNTNFHTDILEDKHGFLWIANNIGLIRYNGPNTTNFQVKDGLQSNEIYRLYDDSDSLLWIQHYFNQNIDIFNPLTNEVTTFEAYFGKNLPFTAHQIAYIFLSQEKTIYIKTRTGFYYKYLGKKQWQKIWKSTTNLSLSVQYINQNKLGQTWVQEKDTCYWVYKDGNTVNSHFVGDSLFVFGEHRQDLIFYQHQAKGIQFFRLKPTGESLEKLSTPIDINEIKNINTLLNHDNRKTHIWNETYQLLSFFNGKQLNLFQRAVIPDFLSFEERLADSLDLKGFYKLKYSNNEHRFIGAGEHLSIIHINHNHFETYPKTVKDNSQSTRAITVDNNNNIYVQSYNTDRLFWKKSPNQSEIIALPPLTESPGLSSFLSKDGHTIIMGTENARLITYNTLTEETHTYHSCDGVLPVFVLWAFWSVYEEVNGQIWIGSRDGIYLLDSVKKCIVPFEQYNDYTSLAKSVVLELYENDKGIWAATNTGLYLIDKNKGVIAYYHSKAIAPFKIPSDHISFIYEDVEQRFWLGTQGDGLIQLDLNTGNYQQWTTQEGLPNNRIHAIYPDDYNNLWLSSNYGLMKMNLDHKTFITFLPEDGLPHQEFNRKSHYKDHAGYLYFGGLKGIVKFHPKHFNRLSPPESNIPFRITKCSKWNREDNKEVDLSNQVLKNQPIDFYPDDVFLTFEYALMDFKAPESHQYSYKIEGYNDNWVITNEHSISFNGLPAGNYTLLIKARAKFSEWQKNNLSIKIRVHTPFYKTYWFIGLCLFVLISLLIAYYRFNIRRLRLQKEQLEQAVEKRTIQIKKDKETIEQQANDLKRLDELKNNFFVNISHELRTPLTLIATPLQHLLEQSILKKGSNKKQFETIKIAYQNSQKLQTLVDEILLLSKSEAHKLDLENSSIRLLPFLQQIHSSFEPKAATQGNDYEFIVDKSLDISIVTDWKKLERILYNLLSNAFKFSPTQKIAFSARLESNNNLIIEVSDFGQGIHPEDINQVFDRYYQSKHLTQIEQGGTGIGLALSYEFARLLGGSIKVISVLNEGSSFQLCLPIVLSNDKEAQSLFYMNQAILPIETKTLPTFLADQQSTILVVEDNDQLRSFIQQLLSDYFQVITAVDGQDAWDILNQENQSIDLIISDIMMPRLDGYQLSKKLKISKKWASTPLIILSARTTSKDKLTALRIGIDDYLVKPFNTQELIVRVQNLLRNYHRKKAAISKDIISKPVESSYLDSDELHIEWLMEVEQLAIQKIEEEAGLFNVATFAEELGLSDRQLRRKLKLLIGISPNQYLRELKLVLAKKYLEEQQFTSVAKVSASIGFNTPSHFIKLYTNRFGKSPLDYFL